MESPQISKVGLIKFQDKYLTLINYKEPLTEIKGGFGYYGCLLSTTDGDKVQCALCGKLYSELGAHVRQSHHISAQEYKEKFGLAYKTSLISENIRQERKMRTLAWMGKMQKKYGTNWRAFFKKNAKQGRKMRGDKQPVIQLETKNKRGTCPDQLIDQILRVKEKLGHTPSKDDFIKETGTQRYVHLIYKTFGSWTKAIEEAGLVLKKNVGRKGEPVKAYDDEELLEFIRIFYEQEKKIPTETDCRRGMLPPSTTYARHFGSLPLARERAGIFGNPTKWDATKTK